MLLGRLYKLLLLFLHLLYWLFLSFFFFLQGIFWELLVRSLHAFLHSLDVDKFQREFQLDELMDQFLHSFLWVSVLGLHGGAYDKLPEFHESFHIILDILESFVLDVGVVFSDLQNSQKGIISNRFSMFQFFLPLDFVHSSLHFPHTAIKPVFDGVVGSGLGKLFTCLGKRQITPPIWIPTHCIFQKEERLLSESTPELIWNQCVSD